MEEGLPRSTRPKVAGGERELRELPAYNDGPALLRITTTFPHPRAHFYPIFYGKCAYGKEEEEEGGGGGGYVPRTCTAHNRSFGTHWGRRGTTRGGEEQGFCVWTGCGSDLKTSPYALLVPVVVVFLPVREPCK